MQLAGFRDPYVIRKGGKGQDWHLLIGSGLNGQGGTLLLYKSKELQSGSPPVCEGLLRPTGQLTCHCQHLELYTAALRSQLAVQQCHSFWTQAK